MKLTCKVNRVIDTSFDVDAYKSWKNENQEPVIEQEKTTEDGKAQIIHYTSYLYLYLSIDKPPRFTFQELVDMIEKGIEIPGKIYTCEIYIWINVYCIMI